MKILLAGSEGYLGSLLGPVLSSDGHDITGLDTGFYRERTLFRDGEMVPWTISKDIRKVEIEDLREMEAIVHLGELSNDPLGQLSPDITCEIIRADDPALGVQWPMPITQMSGKDRELPTLAEIKAQLF